MADDFFHVGLVYRGASEVPSEDKLELTIDETEARSMLWMTRRHATTALVNAAGLPSLSPFLHHTAPPNLDTQIRHAEVSARFLFALLPMNFIHYFTLTLFDRAP